MMLDTPTADRVRGASRAALIRALRELDPDGAWSVADSTAAIRSRTEDMIRVGMIDEILTASDVAVLLGGAP